MPFGIGAPEMIVLLVIVLLLFGPKNLPKLANSIGRAVRDFKSGLSGVDQEIRTELEKANTVETKVETEPRVHTPPVVEAHPVVHRDEKTD